MWKFSSGLLHFITSENLTICFFGVSEVDFFRSADVQKSAKFFSHGGLKLEAVKIDTIVEQLYFVKMNTIFVIPTL